MREIRIYVSFLLLSVLLFGCSGKEGLIRDFDDDLAKGIEDDADKIQVVVGTYNLRLLTSADVGVEDWENRKQWVRKIVDNYDFDILSTQEGYITQIEDVVADKAYAYVAVGRDDGVSAGETSAILYKTDKFDIEDEGTFWLSETPEVPSSGWDATIKRICTWVKFREIASDRVFFVFNAHYDHQGTIARVESSNLMLSKIKEIATDFPVVMTGDLNSEPPSDAVTALVSTKFLWDSKPITRTPATGPEGTYYGYDLTKAPTSRIDYAFVSRKVHVLEYNVINDDFTTGNIASDHLPVRVKVQF